jgi:hypothetical protein
MARGRFLFKAIIGFWTYTAAALATFALSRYEAFVDPNGRKHLSF